MRGSSKNVLYNKNTPRKQQIICAKPLNTKQSNSSYTSLSEEEIDYYTDKKEDPLFMNEFLRLSYIKFEQKRVTGYNSLDKLVFDSILSTDKATEDKAILRLVEYILLRSKKMRFAEHKAFNACEECSQTSTTYLVLSGNKYRCFSCAPLDKKELEALQNKDQAYLKLLEIVKDSLPDNFKYTDQK